MKPNETAAKHVERVVDNATFADFALTLFRAHNALLANAERALPQGLTVARWQVLKVLSRFGGAASVPTIARELALSRQAVQKQVDQLIEQQLLTFRDNPENKRSPLVALTGEGYLVLASAVRRWFAVARRVSERVGSADRERVRELLEQLVATLDLEPTS